MHATQTNVHEPLLYNQSYQNLRLGGFNYSFSLHLMFDNTIDGDEQAQLIINSVKNA